MQCLIKQHHELQQQMQELQQENLRQREEIMRTHSELVQLRADYNHLETAYTLLADSTDNEQRDRVRQRLTNLIAQVDRAIAALKE